MSKQDSHFFTVFSVVLGILIAIAIGIFIFARSIGTPREEARAAEDPAMVAQVAARTAPVGRVAVAGKDNSALAFVAHTEAAPAAALPKTGEETFKAVCSACHGAGIGGAPKAGDHSAWAPRIAQGKAMLYDHAIKGLTGEAGVMPAKGGHPELPDALVKETVDYMVKLAQ